MQHFSPILIRTKIHSYKNPAPKAGSTARIPLIMVNHDQRGAAGAHAVALAPLGKPITLWMTIA
jgi:hypothetical protein